MGGGGPTPNWEGIDKVVRGYFPQDYQLAIAILSFYGSLIGLSRIRASFAKQPEAVEEAPKPTTVVVSSSGIPSIESPDFEKYIESAAFLALLSDGDALAKTLEGSA